MNTYTCTCIVRWRTKNGKELKRLPITVDAADEREAEAVATRRTHRAWGSMCAKVLSVEITLENKP